jgi:hypothetical protein
MSKHVVVLDTLPLFSKYVLTDTNFEHCIIEIQLEVAHKKVVLKLAKLPSFTNNYKFL